MTRNTLEQRVGQLEVYLANAEPQEPALPSDRDLMIRYRMALESIKAIPTSGQHQAITMRAVATQAMEFGDGD